MKNIKNCSVAILLLTFYLSLMANSVQVVLRDGRSFYIKNIIYGSTTEYPYRFKWYIRPLLCEERKTKYPGQFYITEIELLKQFGFDIILAENSYFKTSDEAIIDNSKLAKFNEID